MGPQGQCHIPLTFLTHMFPVEEPTLSPLDIKYPCCLVLNVPCESQRVTLTEVDDGIVPS